jgi:hypothetical protein
MITWLVNKRCEFNLGIAKKINGECELSIIETPQGHVQGEVIR